MADEDDTPHLRYRIRIIRLGFTMYYCLWTTVRVFVSTVSEIKVYIYIYIYNIQSTHTSRWSVGR